MARIFDIDARIDEIEEKAFNPETGEVADEVLFAELEQLQMERDEMVENLCLWVKNLKNDMEAYKEVAADFTKKAKSAENRIESLKNFIGYVMKGEKLKTIKVNMYYSHSTSTSVPEDATTLPPEYQKVTVEANKTAIKKALQEGEVIDGCELVEKTSVVIR